jgi:hypothetical protein
MRDVRLSRIRASTTAIVQNLTVLGTTTSEGWLTATPNTGAVPDPGVCNVAWTAPNQSRSVLAVTQLPASHSVRYSAFGGGTGLVVDLTGYFT